MTSQDSQILDSTISEAWESLLKKISLQPAYGDLLPEEGDKLLHSAFDLALRAHRSQKRRSGEPYILHPIAVCSILCDLNMDITGLAAALLHDVVEDSDFTLTELAEITSERVANIVEGVTKLKSDSHQNTSTSYLRKIVESGTQDGRVYVVKLADRLHNLRTIHHLKPEKQKRICDESSNIYVPLARRLGLYSVYTEMQDICFSVRDPKLFQRIEKLQESSLEKISSVSVSWQHRLSEAISNARMELDFEVVPIHRSVHAIHRRMSYQNETLEEETALVEQVKQFVGGGQFCLITQNAGDCYRLLGMLHSVLKPMHNNILDYIAEPKKNGYQSLHTIVFDAKSGGSPVLIAIRSKAMHQRAKYGIMEENMNNLANQAVQAFTEISANESDDLIFYQEIQGDLAPKRVIVYDELSKAHHLAKDSTILDFAFSKDPERAHYVKAASVDGKLLALFAPAFANKRIELSYADQPMTTPERINFVTTAASKLHIKKWLEQQAADTSLSYGQRALASLLPEEIAQTQQATEDFLAEAGLPNVEEVVGLLSSGKLSLSVLRTRLASNQLNFSNPPLNIVIGSPDKDLQTASCCLPLPGDEIVGKFSDGDRPNLDIHAKNCSVIHNLPFQEEQDFPSLSWHPDLLQNPSSIRVFPSAIKIDVSDQANSLLKTLKCLEDLSLNLSKIETNSDGNYAELIVYFKAPHQQTLNHCLDLLNKEAWVYEVARYFPGKPE